MHLYSSIVLGSLLFTDLASNLLNVKYYCDRLHQSDSVQQQLLAQGSSKNVECSDSKKSPEPGCGRRES